MTVAVESRKVTVTGKRGTLTREFKHVNVAFVVLGKKSIRVDMWFGNRLQLACLRTITTHIENMMVGVTKVRSVDSSLREALPRSCAATACVFWQATVPWHCDLRGSPDDRLLAAFT